MKIAYPVGAVGGGQHDNVNITKYLLRFSMICYTLDQMVLSILSCQRRLAHSTGFDWHLHHARTTHPGDLEVVVGFLS